ncbi:hypothetical protein [Mycobacterium sp. E2238]|uniref:hypothetical protein n=1 Tax=Mycobacterium sp. E2238 TaxID=1834131 RepID=UPI0008003DA6|nr:hypothetical protein [Mycobacterium sp. E2238]OBI31099.1 hypothetical protein A5711_21630 [Mycobacterium sp. E2238]
MRVLAGRGGILVTPDAEAIHGLAMLDDGTATDEAWVAERPDLRPDQLTDACAAFLELTGRDPAGAADLVDVIAFVTDNFDVGDPIAAVYSAEYGWQFLIDVRPLLRREILAKHATKDPWYVL